MNPLFDARLWQRRRGILRSLLVYYGIPWRQRQLVRFYSQFVGPGSLCFDIGAHVGNRLRAWRALGATVIGVEPMPHFMRLLERWYGVDAAVTLVEAAVGDVPGVATLWVSERTPTVTTLSTQWMDAVRRADSFAGVQWETNLEVAVTTLDCLIERFGEPAFCKVDVEGYELVVLRGLSRPLPAISFEYVPAALEVAVGCVEYLSTLGEYVYNWSLGEQHRWRSQNWLDRTDLLRYLRQVGSDESSGDIYARRVDPPC